MHAVSSCSDAKDSSSDEISLVQISLLQVYFQDWICWIHLFGWLDILIVVLWFVLTFLWKNKSHWRCLIKKVCIILCSNHWILKISAKMFIFINVVDSRVTNFNENEYHNNYFSQILTARFMFKKSSHFLLFKVSWRAFCWF